MNANSTLFYELLRTTIALSLIAGTAALVLRLTRLRSPALHRAACLLALVAGWTFLRIPVAVPQRLVPQHFVARSAVAAAAGDTDEIAPLPAA